MPEKTEADAYIKVGLGREYEILAKGCEIPPSLEVFTQEWRDTLREVPGKTAAAVAHTIVANYRRTPCL